MMPEMPPELEAIVEKLSEELKRIGVEVWFHNTGRIYFIIPFEKARLVRLVRHERDYIILNEDVPLLRVTDDGEVVFYGNYDAIGELKRYLNARVESITFHCYSHSLEIVLRFTGA